MAAGYNFAFNMSLQAPPQADIKQVRRTIEAGLKNINVQFDTKGAKKASRELDSVAKSASDAGTKAETFADTITLKGRSFAAYAVASSAIIKLTGALTSATREAFKLEKELAKIAQVTRLSNKQVNQQAGVILEISKNYGVAATKVGELIRMLAQTGMSFRDAAKGAEILARTELLASFENLGKTTEGLIALMSGFNLSTAEAAKGLEAINVVAKNFAVESGDIVEAIKRTGGAFAAANGNINELIGMFTAVRSTSRESAETIATAFRTIFGRLQRPKTIEYFKELNIELADAAGNFVGPMEAINRITEGLEKAGIAAGSIRFAEVVEQIGGIRQYSKVVPLLTQNAKAQRALADANNAAAESDMDVQKAKATLSQQVAELTANFRALVFEITQTESFKLLANIFISAANAAIELTRALKPLIPLLTVVAGIKVGRAFAGAFGAMKAGKIGGFNRGGVVPGQGNSDTVPAMLTPGEFVIRKSAVQAFGAGNLSNINKYATGGTIKTKDSIGFVTAKAGEQPNDNLNAGKDMRLAALRKAGIRPRGTKDMDGRNKVKLDIPYRKLAIAPSSGEGFVGERVTRNALAGIDNFLNKTSTVPQGKAKSNIIANSDAQSSLNGYIFEEIVKKYSGIAAAGGKKPFDFVGGAPLGGSLENDPTPEFLDAARTGKTATDIRRKTLNAIKEQGLEYTSSGFIGAGKGKKTETGRKRRARGGGVHGSDTVPALLTPGEFVVNAKSAKAFGYGRLGKINKYAKGGRVQRFQDGGRAFGPGRAEAAGFDADFSNTIRGYSASIGKSEEEVVRFAKALKDADHDMDAVSQSMKDLTKSNQAGAKQGKVSSREQERIFKQQTGRIQAKGGGRQFSMTGVAAPGGKQEVNTEKLNNTLDKTEKKIQGFGSRLAKINPLALMFGIQAATTMAEQFGVELNNTAMSTKTQTLALAGAAVAAGKTIRGFGLNLRKSGAVAAKNTRTLAQSAKVGLGKSIAFIGRGLSKAGPLLFADLAGMLAEALFTTDFQKEADKQIALGNSAKAAEAAMRNYTQAQLSAIPIIGGIANVLAELIPGGTGLRDFIFGGDAAKFAADTAGAMADLSKNTALFDENRKNLEDTIKRTKPGDTFSDIDKAAGASLNAIDGVVRGAEELTRKLITFTTENQATNTGNFFVDLGRGFSRLFEQISGKSARDVENAQQALKTITDTLARSSQEYSNVLNTVTPSMKKLTQDAILSGDGIRGAFQSLRSELPQVTENIAGLVIAPQNRENLRRKIQRQDLEYAPGGAFDREAEKLQQEIQNKAIEKNAKLTKVNTLAQMESAKASYIRAKAELATADALAAAIEQTQLFKQRLDKINAAYRESARALRVFEQELALFADKVRGFELSRELLETGTQGTAGIKAIEKSLGVDVLKGTFADIRRAGATDELVRRGTRFGGQLVGQQLGTATRMQGAMENLLTGGLSNKDFEDITRQAIKQRGQTDPGIAETFSKNVEAFLQREIFGNDQVPAAFSKRFTQFAEDFGAAIVESGGADLSKLKELSDKFAQDVGGKALKLVQGISEKQAQGIQQLGQAYNKLTTMQLDHVKARLEQERNAQQAMIDIEEQRISSFESIGVDPARIRNMRQRLAERRQKEAFDRASEGELEFGRGFTPVITTITEFEEAAKNARDALKKSTVSDIKNTGADGRTAIAQQKARQQEIADRENLKANIQNQIAAAKDLMSARKAEIDLIIKENDARRENMKAFRDAIGNILTDFAFGTDETRQDMLEAANLTVAAAQRGSLQGFTGEQRGAIGGFLDRFAGVDMALPAFGGKTAAQMKGDLAAREAVDLGLIRPQDFQKFASMARHEALPLDKRLEATLTKKFEEFYKGQRRLQQLINENEKALVDDQGKAIKDFQQSVFNFEAAVMRFFEDRSRVAPPQLLPEERTSRSPNDIPVAEIEAAIKAGAKAQQELRDKYINDRNPHGGPKNARPLEETKKPDAPQRTQQKEDRLRNYLEDLSKPMSELPPDSPWAKGGKALSDMIEGAIREEEARKAAAAAIQPQRPQQLLTHDELYAPGPNMQKYQKKSQHLIDDMMFEHSQRKSLEGLQRLFQQPNERGAEGPMQIMKADLGINIAPQQLTLNIPELQRMTNDSLTKISMAKISAVLKDFVANMTDDMSQNGIHTALMGALEVHNEGGEPPIQVPVPGL